MKQRCKQLLTAIFLGGALCAGWMVMGKVLEPNKWQRSEEDVYNLCVEVGMKASDVNWLYRFGRISEEELEELQEATSKGMNVEDLNDLLDKILEGKEEEFGGQVIY